MEDSVCTSVPQQCSGGQVISQSGFQECETLLMEILDGERHPIYNIYQGGMGGRVEGVGALDCIAVAYP